MLEIKSVSKSFPGVKALDRVSMHFQAGKIHALLGENGAGKSTLIKIICGIHQPDEGELSLNGQPVVLKSYHDAIEKQISIVHQEIQVVPLASVAENIMLDKLDSFTKRGFVDWKALNEAAVKYMQMVELDVPYSAEVKYLSAAQKQLVQIARGLSSGARLLLLDEPTSSLTQHESKLLFVLLNKLKEQGVAIVFVSHKLEEVLSISDQVTVLRDGRFIGTEETRNLDRNAIVSMMIGRTVNNDFRGFLDVQDDAIVLEARNLKNEFFDDLSLSLKKGEILGLYGLVGSGRTEFAKSVIGEHPIQSGELRVNGRTARIRSVSDALEKYKIGYVTENRKEEGLILSDSITVNVTITVWERFSKVLGWLLPQTDAELARVMIKRLAIKTPSDIERVGNLSGGNQQKVSIAKWVLADCDILIIDEPSVGVDVGAKESIHELIWKMAKDEGKTIILISSDMPEMISLARRILVFKEFRIVGELADLNTKEYSYAETSERIGACFA
ncbi:MAG: sugar ABC transporter ATP-binding protein [Propionivibrio sp.]